MYICFKLREGKLIRHTKLKSNKGSVGALNVTFRPFRKL